MWHRRLWVRLAVTNLVVLGTVTTVLIVAALLRIGTVLAHLPEQEFVEVRQRLREHFWSGLAELIGVVDRELTFVLLALLLLSSGVALLLARRYGRYVKDVSGRLEALATGRFTAPPQVLPTYGIWELNVLDHHLRVTAGRLHHLEQERQYESAAIAHELRTPITALRLRLAGLQDGIYTAVPGDLAPMFSQVDQLESLAESLLTLTLADAGHLRLHRTTLGAPELLTPLQQSFQPVAARRGIRLAFTFPAEGQVHVDAVLVRRAVGTVIDNALKYSPSGTAVHVHAALTPAALTVRVTDEGPGVPRDVLHRLTERFYRVDDSRARRSGGTGLGLALARAVTGAHGGRLLAQARDGGGLSVTVHLPAWSGGPDDHGPQQRA
ncbi:sensor histidine kinase [Deinococcus aquiradiocola]|uniref:histidine kinase n=1 Tax=Deinococcus aquiradiocola TaxID=393059 RepID=A0A917P8F7_9DEIO|nr:ATP-binding protein [Deinococcus aquiradiocola]GGJ66681.1 hypothetical protein GCM10008939_08490 [Deinococcus aquiradiocola]